MARCSECGGAVADDLKFCGYCGAKLNIIGEHLGTRILGNTEAIMAALETAVPGASRRYTVLGTVTEGKLAGGIMLTQPQSNGDLVLWSDGDQLTPIEVGHLVEAWHEGWLDWEPTLASTCPRCLDKYHRTRALYIPEPPVPGWEAVNLWLREYCDGAARSHVLVDIDKWLGCPFCWAGYLAGFDIRHVIETSFEKVRQAVSERADLAKALVRIHGPALEWAERIDEHFAPLTESLHRCGLEPQSWDEWRQYQSILGARKWALSLKPRDRQLDCEYVVPLWVIGDDDFREKAESFDVSVSEWDRKMRP